MNALSKAAHLIIHHNDEICGLRADRVETETTKMGWTVLRMNGWKDRYTLM
jgi:hypothetical protein